MARHIIRSLRNKIFLLLLFFICFRNASETLSFLDRQYHVPETQGDKIELYPNYIGEKRIYYSEIAGLVTEEMMSFLPSGVYMTSTTPTARNGIVGSTNGVGQWSIHGESLLLSEYSGILLNYMTEPIDETQKKITPIYSLRELSDAPRLNGDADNVSRGTIRHFGDEIVFVDRDGKQRIFYYLPSGLIYYKDFWEEKYYEPLAVIVREKSTRISNARQSKKTPYYPWIPVEFIWQSGEYKTFRKQYGLNGEPLMIILFKDGLRFTVVNPRYYLPDSGLRLYDKADEEALSAWMDTVQVGQNYEFELMRPAYPADSIAYFPPLQTVPDSIYAADGEAYGYFFARIKSR